MSNEDNNSNDEYSNEDNNGNNCKESHKKDKDDNLNNKKKVVAKIRVKIRVRRWMIRMIRIMMILRITRIIHMKKMIEITSTGISTSTRTIINVTIAFRSYS